MTIAKVLKVFAIVLMAIVLLMLASWVNTLWTGGANLLAGLLPSGDEPIAITVRSYLPTVKSVGTVVVLIVVGILGWGFGRRIWTA